MQAIDDRHHHPSGDDQGVPVGQKDAADMTLPGNPVDILPDIFQAPDAKFLLLVGGAEGTAIVGAPQGDLEYEAPGFAGRTNNNAFVSHTCRPVFIDRPPWKRVSPEADVGI
jgi:hypothetical protein